MIRRLLAGIAAAAVLSACGEKAPEPAPAETPAPAEAPAAPAGPLESPEAATPAPAPGEAAAPAEAAPSPAPASAAIPADLKVIMGDVTPGASSGLLVAIPAAYASRTGMYAHRDAMLAFGQMHADAKAAGVNLKIISAFRSFKDQKRIWDNKWNGTTLVEGGKLPETVPDPAARARKILEFSSMPGTSRHHWGTDFDLNDLTNTYFASGEGKAIHDWLSANAGKYGFCQVYSPKGPDRPNGYEREDWHWSYMPVASGYLAQYPDLVGYDHLTGFEGAEAARQIDVIANYVQGINPACGR